jgi:ribonuclease P protein component
MPVFSFKKNEILRKKKLTGQLFSQGASFRVFPYRVVWMVTTLEENVPAQVMFSVGKRSFRNATDRNRVRRVTREAYRLRKHELYAYLEKEGKQLVLAFVYASNKQLPLIEANQKIIAIFTRLYQELNKNNAYKKPLT